MDLPQLSSIDFGWLSASRITSFSATSRFRTDLLADVPFTNGHYSVKQAFAFIQPDAITCDEGTIV